MKKIHKTAILVGRFQVNQLSSHEGYAYLLNKVTSENDRVIVFIGSAPTVSKSDPLVYKHREAMFNEEYPGIIVRELKDVITGNPEKDNQEWTNAVDTGVESMINGGFGPCDVTMYGGRDSFLHTYKKYNGKFRTEYLENVPLHHHSATGIRTRIMGEFISNPWVRYGLIQAEMKRYNTMFPTVDVIVTRDNGKQIMLAQKPNEVGTGRWRCIGGFIEPGNRRGVLAAARELEEEANLTLDAKDFKYVSQIEIEDSRYKYTQDSVMTTLFTVNCPDEMVAVGGDDIALVDWFDINEVSSLINPVHKQVWDDYLQYHADLVEHEALWAEFLAFKSEKELALR